MEKERQLIFAIDLDHTLADTDLSIPPTWERYSIAKPMKYNIDFVNKLYDAGHRIVIYTARGMLSCGENLNLIHEKNYNVTIAWLHKHGVKFHELRFGKMFYDFLVDDKAININDIDQLTNYTISKND